MRVIPDEDMLVIHSCHTSRYPDEYRDGVLCKCGATILIKNREPYEPVVVVCPECGFVIMYG